MIVLLIWCSYSMASKSTKPLRRLNPLPARVAAVDAVDRREDHDGDDLRSSPIALSPVAELRQEPSLPGSVHEQVNGVHSADEKNDNAALIPGMLGKLFV